MRKHFILPDYLLAMTGFAAVLVGTQAMAQKTRPVWEEARAVQIEAARREGILTIPRDLHAPALPPDQNAATYMAKIRDLDKAAPVSREDAAALEAMNTAEPTPDQIAQGRKALEAHSERFRLLHQVARCPAYWEATRSLDVEGIQVPDVFPRNAQFRDYARWLVAESMLLLYEGKPLDAIQGDALVFNLARQVASSGSVISLLVGNAIDSIAIGGMRSILYHEGANAAVAEAVVQAMEARRSAPDLGLALRGEVVFEMKMYDSQRLRIPAMLRGEPGNASNPPFKKTPEYRVMTRKYHYPIDPAQAASRFLAMNDAHSLAWMRRLFPLVDLPYPEALPGIKAIAREAEENQKHPDYSLAAISTITWAMMPAVKARQQALAETVRTAAALLAWQARHGHFPDTLAEGLTPTPLDPFDLRPLRYRREGEGFVLYSIGQTGKFDGGQPNQKSHAGESLFRYPRPVSIHK